MGFTQIHYKPEIIITSKGRIKFPSELVNPYRYDSKRPFILLGADILYSPESEELAFDIYRKELDTYRARTKHDIIRATKALGASLYFDTSYALDARAYLPLFNFEAHAKNLKGEDNPHFDHTTNEWKTRSTSYAFVCHQIDSFLIIKLNPNNPKSLSPSLFHKLTPKRFRKSHEITLSKRGLLTLPKDPIKNISRKCDISFDPTTQTFQLTFTPNGSRTVHEDNTIRLDTFLKLHSLRIPNRLHLNFNLAGNTLTFKLDDPAPDTLEIRRVQQALGVLL